jgi:hypothetical protein
MSEIHLTGLKADAAHGFLAAMGVLAATRFSVPELRLHWTSGFIPHAVLTGVDPSILIDVLLADRDQRLDGAVLNHPAGEPYDTLKCTAEELAVWAARIADLPDEDPDVDLWSALVIEGGFDNNNRSKPTHFDFSAGQVKFLKVVRDIAAALTAEMLTEALYGPWRYESSLSTLRFEKEGERMQALRAIPPANEPLKGVPGADWLAFRGLALYPLSLAPGRDRARVVTPACDTNWNRGAFRWPVWADPLAHDAVAALATDPRLVGEEPAYRQHDTESLEAWGIRSIWESSILRSGQGYGSFGPAKQIARGVHR